MPFRRHCCRLFLIAAAMGLSGLPPRKRPAPPQKRSVEVADIVRMTRISGTGYAGVHPKEDFAVFSPDGKWFAVVISKPNLEDNSNEYSLLLFSAADESGRAAPRILASFSSSSDNEGISAVRWSRDSATIFFLGARGNDTVQLYSIGRTSSGLKQLSSHPTSIRSYDLSEEANEILYSAEKPETQLRDEIVLAYAVDLGRHAAWDLISGRATDSEPELFATQIGSTTNKPLRTRGVLDRGIGNIHLSRDGRYSLVKTDTAEIPPAWKNYEDSNLQALFRMKVHKGYRTNVLRYELLDLSTANSEVLLDSPVYGGSEVLWSPDSSSVLLCGVYLPLDVSDPGEQAARRSTRFVVQINVRTRSITKITADDLRPVDWNPVTDVLRFRERRSGNNENGPSKFASYRETAGVWVRLNVDSEGTDKNQTLVVADQDLNSPPRIVAVDPQTRRKTTLLDLNPQISGLALGKVSEIRWMDRDGNPLRGALYLPPDYAPGRRYPLVIQTHGFNPHAFWVDGPYPTAFAAQVLVSKGIAVLQVNDIFLDSVASPREAERAMAAYESAVEYLEAKEIVDGSRVGLIGFSRTCLYVKYALTHSARHFAAAVAADGFDAGYMQYLFSANQNATSDSDSVVGARPFGAGLQQWLKRSPGFLLDRVRTPVLLQSLGPGSLLGEWQWFSGLRLLERPVDLIYLPTGSHSLVKPRDRLISLDATVDWFCFWLKDQTDPDPRKRERYARWTKFAAAQSGSQEAQPDLTQRPPAS